MERDNNCKRALVFMALAVMVLMNSCSGTKDPERSAGNADTAIAIDEYHADNDIAMTVRSIVDALRVGEPLDTSFYNFEGILTDGQGHPLYTDIQGTPGRWEVDVISPTSVVIRNMNIGDLLPDYLESYLTGSLNLSANNVIETAEYDDDEETQLSVYDFQGGYLRFETRASVAQNGLEGPLMSIIATKTPPTDVIH